MIYDDVRLLEGIGEDLRQRILPKLDDANVQRYVTMIHTLLATCVAERRARPWLDSAFMIKLAELLSANDAAPAGNLGDRAQELQLLAKDLCWDAVESRLGAFLSDLLARGEAESAKLAALILELEADRRDGIAAAWSAQIDREASNNAGPQGSLTYDDIAGFRNFLRMLGGDDGLEVEASHVVVGGYSKQTIILQLSNSGTLPPEVVIRRDRAVTAIATTVVDEFELITALHEAGVAVAKPLALSADEGTMPYMVSERVGGRSIGDPWVVHEPSEPTALSLAEHLARLHSLPPADFGNRVDGALLPTRDYMLAALDATSASWSTLRRTSPVIDAGLGWVYAHIDDCEGHRSLVHRDVGCHNMLVGPDDRIAALLDWETAWIGHRARDLSYVRHLVEQCTSWDRFRAAYEESGGDWPSDRELRFYAIWGDLQAAVECTRSGHLFFAGKTQDISFGYSGIYNTERFVQRIARALASH